MTEPIFRELVERLDRIESKITPAQTWLSVSDLANYLGVSESTVRRLVSRREIPFHRIGSNGCLTFNRKLVDLWLLTGEKQPGKRSRAMFQDLL